MKSSNGRRTRSDVTRNREAILSAALSTLNGSPRASMEEIAISAGVSRATLYGHFSSRQALVASALHRAASEANALLSGLDPTLPPEDAVAALIATSWRVLGDMAGIWTVASGELSAWELRRLHQEPADRIRRLLLRGRRDGAFRTDQNVHWQVECIYAIAQAGVSLTRTNEPACTDPAATIAATVRAVLAAEPAESGGATPEPRPR